MRDRDPAIETRLKHSRARSAARDTNPAALIAPCPDNPEENA
ncbi:hypothetical protein BSU04_02605 [Caballeronia sordidicola]|uniref:Uncharacterized protein n=1 Tax=Caballeronia sordidicola TaxID=196367 RepID=A0A226X9G6_CABSO|nr:hypothetical protein BSU04_02605 [Caballeronia sordidicola]